MTWVRLDDAFATNPKIFMLSDGAFRAYVMGLCYSAHHLSDGFVPAGYVKTRGARELEVAGLWTQDGAGWQIHDFLDFNPSREEVEAKSNAARNAARKRWGEESSTESQSDSHTERTRGRVGVGDLEVGGESPREGVEPTSDFEDFFAAFPTARKGARRPTLVAWNKALTRANPITIVTAALRYRDDPNREDEFTKGAAAWLNADGWEWGPQPSRNGSVRREETTAERVQRLGIE